jgi:3-phosphoshikimate 1-carboxyvinyltransferase
MAEFLMNPDREMVEQALVMGLLVNGRTVLEDFVWTDRSLRFAKVLGEFGLRFEQKGHQLVLDGTGLQYKCPTFLSVSFEAHPLSLLLGLASRDTDIVYTVAGSTESLALARKILTEYFCVKIESESSDSIVFQFLDKMPEPKLTPVGNVPYLFKNAILLNALVSGKNVVIEERQPIRDQWSELLLYFGVPMTLDKDTGEVMDELARRMAKAKGIKVESKLVTRMQEAKVLTSHDYFVPGDTTEAAAFATLGVIGPLPKENRILLKNVGINTGRSGFFSALKRMGADVEFTSRRERYGSAFGNIEVKRGKRLQGRRLSPEILSNSLEEYPFLALAACAADGETILRVPECLSEGMRPLFERLAENLRKTGAEIGVYEEGLVIRGKEELDAGTFDCNGDPVLGLMLFVLSLFATGITTVEGIECVEAAFPGVCEKLKSAAVVAE